MKPRLAIPVLVFMAIVAGFFVYPVKSLTSNGIYPQFLIRPFRLGLDLLGGTHLVYQADMKDVAAEDRSLYMEGLKDVIERRVNLFGVSEPVVTVNRSGDSWRLIVELAGVKDISQAIKIIGQTPFLEFREGRPEPEVKKLLEGVKAQPTDPTVLDLYFTPTPLTGRYLKKSSLGFDSQTGRPEVVLQFDNAGKQLFAEITKRNIGKQVAIYLDGEVLSAPVVQQEIGDGNAVITGSFSAKEARELVERLNSGALPVPINLVSQQSVGAALGRDSLEKSLTAGAIGFVLVAVFMTLWYRLAGLTAVAALVVYALLTLTIFKLVPVTLTLAGLAGFVLSVGMAVDANILIFERMKEELRAGRVFGSALEEGFARAWTSIKDSNVSSLITAFILYWFGASLVRGFALTLIIGVLVSMFSAITLTRTFLRGLAGTRLKDVGFLWKR